MSHRAMAFHSIHGPSSIFTQNESSDPDHLAFTFPGKLAVGGSFA
jgi:hypothetical protein